MRTNFGTLNEVVRMFGLNVQMKKQILRNLVLFNDGEDSLHIAILTLSTRSMPMLCLRGPCKNGGLAHNSGKHGD